MMRGDLDGPTESDVRELRTLLKSAQNDVKTYAAHVIRLQQELDRERLKNQAPADDTAPLGLRDDEVEGVAYQSVVVEKALERLRHEMKAECAVCHCQRQHGRAPETMESVPDQLQRVQELLVIQKQQLVALAKENAKLRDSLDKRPSHRDLARSQWQVEGLQSQLNRLKEERRTAQPPTNEQPQPALRVYDTPATGTLTDRVSVDKLLNWLHVETKTVKRTGLYTKQSRFTRRRFLKEPVECYLVVDSAALDSSPSQLSASTMTENEKTKKREQISRRVGMLCSEIVAACCHSVGVYEIAKLPQYVEASYQYAQLVPLLQDFVDRIDRLTQAAALRADGGALQKESDSRATSDQGFLDTLTARVQDLVFEIRARRDQMKPPGDKALSVVLRCMKLLRADRIDQLTSTIEKLIASTRCEKEFLRDVRKLLGLDLAAPRADVLALIKQLLDQVGLSVASSSPTKKSNGEATRRSRTTERRA